MRAIHRLQDECDHVFDSSTALLNWHSDKGAAIVKALGPIPDYQQGVIAALVELIAMEYCFNGDCAVDTGRWKPKVAMTDDEIAAVALQDQEDDPASNVVDLDERRARA
jgi:hypothetical protein